MSCKYHQYNISSGHCWKNPGCHRYRRAYVHDHDNLPDATGPSHQCYCGNHQCDTVLRTISGSLPSFGLLLIQGHPVQALYFAIMILVIQQLDGNVIGPKIVGSVIGINSFWVLISVLIGGGLFGFIGMGSGRSGGLL